MVSDDQEDDYSDFSIQEEEVEEDEVRFITLQASIRNTLLDLQKEYINSDEHRKVKVPNGRTKLNPHRSPKVKVPNGRTKLNPHRSPK